MEGANLFALAMTLRCCRNNTQRVEVLRTCSSTDQQALLLLTDSDAFTDLLLKACDFLLPDNTIAWSIVLLITSTCTINFSVVAIETFVASRYWKVMSRLMPHVLMHATRLQEAWLHLKMLQHNCLKHLSEHDNTRHLVSETIEDDHWSFEDVICLLEIERQVFHSSYGEHPAGRTHLHVLFA